MLDFQGRQLAILMKKSLRQMRTEESLKLFNHAVLEKTDNNPPT